MAERMLEKAGAVALALAITVGALPLVASSGACTSFSSGPTASASSFPDDSGTLSMDGAPLDGGGGGADSSVDEAGCVGVNRSAAAAAPSCSALTPTCGPDESGDCCAWNEVEGGTFNRGNNPDFPATVCSFRLDTYEITVGRFRKFAAVYDQNMIGAGAGKNVNNPNDPGWNVGWNAANLPLDKNALIAAVKCAANYQTWTDTVSGPNENKPMNCINWFEAEAFCIWDGGRLPTEAEWNYAAAGGSAQRRYPWGDAGPGPNADLAVYGCWFNGNGGQCTGVTNIAYVGSAKNGNGKWGHANLAGNVWEWVQDWDRGHDIVPCDNCADTKPGVPYRVTLGGAFDGPASYVLTSSRFGVVPTGRGEFVGARCARTP